MSHPARSITEAQDLGFDHAAAGRSPDSDRIDDPDYMAGFRDGLLTRIRWAREDLDCFDAEYDHHPEYIWSE